MIRLTAVVFPEPGGPVIRSAAGDIGISGYSLNSTSTPPNHPAATLKRKAATAP
jgi:hypothetical protein